MIALANDLVMAAEILRPDSDSRAAIQTIANALISTAIATDPTLSENVVAAAAAAVDTELGTRALLQSTGASTGGLQERFPDSDALGWKSDTDFVDGNLGTTLPGPATVAALQRVGFPVGADAPPEEGVGFGIRAADGRNTALETATTYDEVTGVVPRSLRAQIADGLVTAHHNIKGPALAALVPAGRFVLHEQADGFHLILGEKTNA
ncbi:hypothetical protein [Microbacterium oleivorans]|uniref:Uncharacterized protein n=1 Tax=Microbacterium oleivorans TaxID=273677 RepID=A0A7D5IW41_9MICO|nr:hypothetical protein [Microbacterium oleivorans]QLD10876.1 hypothetical protein HW566_03210 [Microbacterium oleivorans]